MTELVYSADRAGEAQALLTHQLLGKTVLDALIAADVQQSQEIEDAVAQLRSRLDIDSQVGAQLDAIGALVGQPREGRQDPEYRLWLKARVLVNRSSGSPKDIYAIAYILLGADADIYLQQIPVGHVLTVAGAFPAPSVVAVQRLLQDASSIAVPFYQQFAYTAYDRIAYAAGSTPIAASNSGFDNGRLVDWIGPDQTPNPYANIAHAFGRRLIDCWDCRRVVYDSTDTALRLPGLHSELSPFELGAFTYAPIKASSVRKESITGISFSAQRAFATSQHVELFGGSDPWTVALHMTRGSDFDDRVFEVARDPSVEVGANAQFIAIVVTSSATALTLYDGGSVGGVNFGTGIAASTAATLIVSYDGAGNGTCWINGTKYTASGTHISVPSLAQLTWGGYYGTDDTVAWEGYKCALFDRVLTDAEAALLTDILDREFTDNAYY